MQPNWLCATPVVPADHPYPFGELSIRFEGYRIVTAPPPPPSPLFLPVAVCWQYYRTIFLSSYIIYIYIHTNSLVSYCYIVVFVISIANS